MRAPTESANVKLFLSSVSAEFRSYRERLRHLLTRPNVEVKVQEDFIITGNETLEMIDSYIQVCDGVIHLVGDMSGAMASASSAAAIQERYPDLVTLLNGLRPMAARFLTRNGRPGWHCFIVGLCSSLRLRQMHHAIAITGWIQPNSRCSNPI
jgi:hypothetical protein